MKISEPPILSLLIATRDRKDELLRTLGTVLPFLPAESEILIFDDGSRDGTTPAVQAAFPQVRVIRHYNSIGYIGARNRLLAAARGIYSISLDDDAEMVIPDFAVRIINHFVRRPECGVISFSIYWGAELPPRLTRPSPGPQRVTSFVGCGHAWRMAAWRDVAPYPEWFEFYGEEDYAARRLLASGWEVDYLPDVVVHHRVDMAARQAARDSKRYRRHFRSGLFVQMLFLPTRDMLRSLGSSWWAQIRQRLLQEHDLSALLSLGWVAGSLLRHLPRIRRERTAFTKDQWQAWKKLTPTVIYWTPKDNSP